MFQVKENPNSSVSKYIASLVANGFHGRVGANFSETFSPIIKLIIVHIVLTIAVTNNWSIQEIDVNNAFLNGILEEKVYMQQPTGLRYSYLH